jgi:hypothetical protein
MRRHLTYANVAATLALVFAMTGGAIAAKHYLINSTSQINPKVLKRLRGPVGPPGKPGATGREGDAGRQGPAGTTGLQGPVSVTRVDFFEPVSREPNRSGEFKFLGQTVTDHFTGTKTAADLTASVDVGSSNGKQESLNLGICFMPAGGHEAVPVAIVTPEFTLPEETFLAQTVTGVVTGVTAGDYILGVCTDDESANVLHGNASGSVLLAETTEGGTTGVAALGAAARAQAASR